MAIDPSKMAPGRIEQMDSGGTAFVGESATRLYQLRVVISMLKLEMKGLKGRFSALAKAKQLTGLTANNRPAQIAALEALCTQLAANINKEPHA